jgi:hypothetical protein
MTGPNGFAIRAGTAAPGRPISPGEIEAGPDAAGLFPAESFFNINAEVDLPLFGVLYNLTPLVVENSGVMCFPPKVVYLHRHTGPVQVVMKHDDTQVPKRWRAGDKFGWLVLAGHGVNLDTVTAPGSAPRRDARTAVDDFEDLVDAEPEMSDTATARVDLEDVITHAANSAFADPAYRGELLGGINGAASLGQAGQPCAGTQYVIDLYQFVDGHPGPDDWVVDPTVRAVIAERLQVLGAHLQAQANQSGGCLPTAVPGEDAAPNGIAILGIRPNPTVSEATIAYSLPKPGRVSIAVYDLTGRLVVDLVDADLPAGVHRAVWNGQIDRVGGRRASSGVYFVRMTALGETRVRRLTITQ